MFDLSELGVGDLRGGTGRAPAAQGVNAAGLPAGMPQAHGLAGDAELAGDLSLANADSEQLASAQPAGLEPFTVLLCRRAASDGRHTPILGRRVTPLQLGHIVNPTPKTR
jgi:hypothetical protein